MNNNIQSIEIINKNYKRAYDYHLTLFKNDYPTQNAVGKEKNTYTYIPYNLKENEYIFYNFKYWDIGASVALSEDDYMVYEGKRLNYCCFEDCNIKNVVFRNCSFSGSKFLNVKFERVIFDNCKFTVPVCENGKGVEELYYAPCIFTQCIFWCDFIDCNLENCLFEKTSFSLSKCLRCSFMYSVMNACALSEIVMNNCDMKDFSICKTDIMKILINDDKMSSVNENTFIDFEIGFSKKQQGEKCEAGFVINCYDEICMDKAKSLKRMSKLFGDNGYSNLEGEYFYKAKNVELKGMHGLKKGISILGKVLCGYGERPSYTFYTIIISTLVFAVLYMFNGISTGGEVINYSFSGDCSLNAVAKDFLKCLFFSITTFSTVGYGNYIPVGAVSMAISGVHMFVGVSLCALWTGCIFRKIAR